MSKRELTSKIKKIKALKLQAKELEAQIDSLENEIKAEMTAKGVEEMTVDIFKVKFAAIVSNRFDTTAFKKAHEDIYKMFCKESKSMRFTIS